MPAEGQTETREQAGKTCYCGQRNDKGLDQDSGSGGRQWGIYKTELKTMEIRQKEGELKMTLTTIKSYKTC